MDHYGYISNENPIPFLVVGIAAAAQKKRRRKHGAEFCAGARNAKRLGQKKYKGKKTDKAVTLWCTKQRKKIDDKCTKHSGKGHDKRKAKWCDYKYTPSGRLYHSTPVSQVGIAEQVEMRRALAKARLQGKDVEAVATELISSAEVLPIEEEKGFPMLLVAGAGVLLLGGVLLFALRR